MRVLTKRVTTIAAALTLALTASVFATNTHTAFGIEVIILDSEESLAAIDVDNFHDTETQVSSLRITQGTEDGLEVECGGNLKCEIIDDNTVVTTSNTTTTTITNSITGLNQSNIIQFSNDFDVIDEQGLNTMIEGMVDRLLDEISGDLQTQLNSLSLSIYETSYLPRFVSFIILPIVYLSPYSVFWERECVFHTLK